MSPINFDYESYTSCTVLPVVVIDNVADAKSLANAIFDGGINIIEVTLRTDAALEAIKLIRDSVPQMIVGAGTVTNERQAKQAKDAGAVFAVSPGSTKNIISGCELVNLPLIPAATTPSECMNLFDEGFHLIKFFPAVAAGGKDFLKSISAPLPLIKFIPTGGISLSNAERFLMLPNVTCVGGTWVANRDAIQSHNWQAITENARKASSLTT